VRVVLRTFVRASVLPFLSARTGPAVYLVFNFLAAFASLVFNKLP
jgi:hypothetical protein